MTNRSVPIDSKTPRQPASPAPIDAATLQRWLGDRDEIALLDVREHGQYGEGHPLFAVHAPYSRLELDIVRLVPRLQTRIVLFDDGDASARLSARAARCLATLGYSNLSVLTGGAPAWGRSGHALFKGVNVPSKTFGEVVEHALHVPHIAAAELVARRAAGERFILLDGRTLEEHRKMTLPGAVPVPNGELALRWSSQLADEADRTTPIVVHCAGRTRSIVGAQILRDVGVPNPVYAFENGTQGWALAGLELERGSTRTLPAAAPLNSPQSASAKVALDAALKQNGVQTLSTAAAQDWIDDPGRTTFVFDVRTPEECAQGSLPGARNAPGGQLIQALDLQVGVRHARILLLDDDGIRASVVALWLNRLGWQAAAVSEGIGSGLRVAPAEAIGALADLAPVARQSTQALVGLRKAASTRPAAVIDLRPSQDFRRSHAVGAVWSIRPRLVADVRALTSGDHGSPVLLLAAEESIARLAAQDLHEAGWLQVSWAPAESTDAADWPSVATPGQPSDDEAIDFLRFVHDRHDGNLDAARRYLEWETGLIAQCTPDELGSFNLGSQPTP